MSIFLLVSLLIIKIKTSASLQCYSYCLGSKAVCEDASKEVGKVLNCSEDEICLAQKTEIVEHYRCLKTKKVGICEKVNRLTNVCFTCNEDHCNTVEKLDTMVASRIQCYRYCIGLDCIMSRLPEEPSSGPCGSEMKHCVGMKKKDKDYYNCGNADFEEKCQKFNKMNAVCLFCEGNLCNRPEVVAEMEKSRLQCYHHCTGNMCTKKFGKPWNEGHTQICPASAVGCVGTKNGKQDGELFMCVENKKTALEICKDEIKGNMCIYCETSLCNSPEDDIFKLQCYSFCFQPYEEMTICKTINGPVAQKVICPEDKRAGCMVVKMGNSEAYTCASEEDKDKCLEMNQQGEGICLFCDKSICNTQGAINDLAKKFLPLGVSMCYFVDSRDNQSKVIVKSCKFPYKFKYKCASVIEERPNGSVSFWKSCTSNEGTEMRPECIANVKNGKQFCYTCKHDLCNKNNFSEIDLGQEMLFDGSVRFTHLLCWWNLCLSFFPVVLSSLRSFFILHC